MDKEEKKKVIIDYNEYQDLLTKANSNKKYIEDKESELLEKYNNKVRNLESQSHRAFNEGLEAGISMTRIDVAKELRKNLLKSLDLILKDTPALSFWSYITGEANSLFCSRLREEIDKTLKNSIRNMCR